MEETFFPTSTPAMLEEMATVNEDAYVASYGELVAFYTEGKAEIKRLNERYSDSISEINTLRIKIANAAGVIADYYSENGEITDELRDIAKYLDIPLTKEISGTAVYEISWSATVPLDFDADDIEIYFSVECQSDVEDFDWNEDNCEVNGSDD